jgi:manganese oxidase
MRRTTRALALAGALALFAAAPAAAQVRNYWVAAVPTSWNIVPNGHDAIMDMPVDAADSIFPTVVYRRYSKGWAKPLPNAVHSSADGLLIPGPLIKARVGDQIRVHFKNMDTLRHAPHSMHFHGVHYRPSSDGAYVPGFSGGDADVMPGHTWTYKLRAGNDSWGVWPYHDHSPSMHDSIAGGMFGMLSILKRHQRAPDREFEVVFTPFGKFMSIDGRAFVGNTPVFKSRVGDLVQWDVMAMGSEHHTFHVHGHRWIGPGGIPRDTVTVGPAESFRSAGAKRTPARGCITATSRTT